MIEEGGFPKRRLPKNNTTRGLPSWVVLVWTQIKKFILLRIYTARLTNSPLHHLLIDLAHIHFHSLGVPCHPLKPQCLQSINWQQCPTRHYFVASAMSITLIIWHWTLFSSCCMSISSQWRTVSLSFLLPYGSPHVVWPSPHNKVYTLHLPSLPVLWLLYHHHYSHDEVYYEASLMNHFLKLQQIELAVHAFVERPACQTVNNSVLTRHEGVVEFISFNVLLVVMAL